MPIKLDLATIDFVSATLKKEKVFTLQRLTSLLNCSRRTLSQKMAILKIPLFTSLTHLRLALQERNLVLFSVLPRKILFTILKTVLVYAEKNMVVYTSISQTKQVGMHNRQRDDLLVTLLARTRSLKGMPS